MHWLPRRRLAAALTLLLFLLSPLAQRSWAADPLDTPANRIQQPGSARRLPIAAQQTNQPTRVGGLPRRSFVSQAAYDEAVAEPLPELLGETWSSIPMPAEAELNRCGAESCSCAGGAKSACGSAGICLPLSLPMLHINWCRFEFFGGVQGFAGPANFADAGRQAGEPEGSTSFGIHQGLNETRPLPLFGDQLSAQLGFRTVQANLNGARFTDEERRQTFVTGGLFRRVDYGVQGGVVVDYLNDDWYASLNLLQLRGDVSWMTGRCNEFGYRFMSGLSDDSSTGTIRGVGGEAVTVTMAAETLDQHRLFYRRHFREGGFAELFAGVSGDQDGLLGGALELPLRSAFVLRTGVTYLSPGDSDATTDYARESWNLGVSLVWYPCGRCGWSRYHRPLFEVADNGSLLVGRR